MKTNYLTRIAATGIIGAVALLSGCMNNTEMEVGLRFKQKHNVLTPKEHYSETLDKIYDSEDSLHNKTRVSQKTVESALMQGYKNRNNPAK